MKRLFSLLKALGLFAGLGPLIGWLVILIIGIVPDLIRTGHSNILPLMAIWFLFCGSYIIGAIPSLIIGFCAWLLRTRLHRWTGAVICGAVGVAMGYIVVWVISQHPSERYSISVLDISPGVVVGFICGLIYFWPRKNLNNQPDNAPERKQ